MYNTTAWNRKRMSSLFSYLSLRGLWLETKSHWVKKIAMMFSLPAMSFLIRVLFICILWKFPLFCHFSAYSLLCVWYLSWEHNKKVKCWKVVNSSTHTRMPCGKYVEFREVLYNALNVYCCTFLWCFSAESGSASVNIRQRWKENTQIIVRGLKIFFFLWAQGSWNGMATLIAVDTIKMSHFLCVTALGSITNSKTIKVLKWRVFLVAEIFSKNKIF